MEGLPITISGEPYLRLSNSSSTDRAKKKSNETVDGSSVGASVKFGRDRESISDSCSIWRRRTFAARRGRASISVGPLGFNLRLSERRSTNETKHRWFGGGLVKKRRDNKNSQMLPVIGRSVVGREEQRKKKSGGKKNTIGNQKTGTSRCLIDLTEVKNEGKRVAIGEIEETGTARAATAAMLTSWPPTALIRDQDAKREGKVDRGSAKSIDEDG